MNIPEILIVIAVTAFCIWAWNTRVKSIKITWDFGLRLFLCFSLLYSLGRVHLIFQPGFSPQRKNTLSWSYLWFAIFVYFNFVPTVI